MTILFQHDEDKAKFKLPHDFDRSAQTDFRQAYAGALDDLTGKVVEIDFSDVHYIDSSGLGSLLLLRELVEKLTRTISIVQCQPTVMKTLMMANFHRIFDIH